MPTDESGESQDQPNFCLPKDSGIDKTKAELMKSAIRKVFEEHQVSFDPKILMAISYSTDTSD